MSGREERERAVELYFTTSMSTKQVVEHLGYPTATSTLTFSTDPPQVRLCHTPSMNRYGYECPNGRLRHWSIGWGLHDYLQENVRSPIGPICA